MINTKTEDAAPEFDMKEFFEQARPALPRQLDDEDIRYFIGEREQCLSQAGDQVEELDSTFISMESVRKNSNLEDSLFDGLNDQSTNEIFSSEIDRVILPDQIMTCSQVADTK